MKTDRADVSPMPTGPTASVDESELVRRAQAGDPDAFARLYDASLERIYRYIYFRVADQDSAEDLTSEVFLKAWENLGRYRPERSPFIAWLYTIARNAVIDHYRTRKADVPLESVRPAEASRPSDLDEQVEAREDADRLSAALRQLTDDQQSVLTLKFFAGLDTEQIARQLGKRQGAVRALQMRALQAMAKHLGLES